MSKYPFLQKIIGLVVFAVMVSSCGQVSSFQTGRTLGKGNTEVGGAVEAFGVNETGDIIGVAVLPNAEAWVQHGVSEKADIGVKVSTGANIQFLGKYQILGNQESPFATSLGAGVEIQANDKGLGGLMRYQVPIYFSWHSSPKHALYFTPRYLFQSVQDGANTHFFGASGGHQWQLNERMALGVEGSLYSPNTVGNNSTEGLLFQVGVGAKFAVGK